MPKSTYSKLSMYEEMSSYSVQQCNRQKYFGKPLVLDSLRIVIYISRGFRYENNTDFRYLFCICVIFFLRLSKNTTARASGNNTSEREALSENCTICACSTEAVAAVVDLLFLQLSTESTKIG